MACSHCKPWLWQRGSLKMCACHVFGGARVPNTAPVTLLHNRQHLVKYQKKLGRKRRKGEMSIFENEQITQTIILKSGLKGEVVRNFLKKKSHSKTGARSLNNKQAKVFENMKKTSACRNAFESAIWGQGVLGLLDCIYQYCLCDGTCCTSQNQRDLGLHLPCTCSNEPRSFTHTCSYISS